MDWKLAIERWRSLRPEEQGRIGLAHLPRKVARSMAFEGERGGPAHPGAGTRPLLHRRICADLTPDFAGRWRTNDIVVGEHDPPAYLLVPQGMREYALDLQARLSALPRSQ